MPLNSVQCDECGTTHTVCPDCGSGLVTPRESTIVDVLYTIDMTDQDEVEQRHVCWECGWTEYLTITIERREEPG